MDNSLNRLFRDFDTGRISRRELFRALGLAALAVPAMSLAQGRGQDSTGRGGRAGGRGGRPRTAGSTNFAWGIEPWDTNKVEAELKKRGLNPVADHRGSDFKSFHIHDPDGFDIQLTNGTKANRRRGAANMKP